MTPGALVRAIYRKLTRTWGPQHWWPAETPFEVIVGAILTQNTSWTNVERAMASLRSAGALTLERIHKLPIEELEVLVRSSGYFRQKAKRLKSFAAFVHEKYDGSLDRMFQTPTPRLRDELLSLNGIGPETADSILLYAGNHETFVVDAYTRRVLERHEAVKSSARYDEIRVLVERALQREKGALTPITSYSDIRPVIHEPSTMSSAERTCLAQTYNEMHGLFVQIGKHYCHKQEPKCEQCPLEMLLPRQAK